jgi:hypothetical protein
VSVVHSVRLSYWSTLYTFINVPTLAHLMEHCQSLKVLSLVDLNMDEDHCRALGAYSRPDLEIEFDSCTITSAGASALAEVLGRNQGPTGVVHGDIDNLLLADGLRGNSRLKVFKALISPTVGNQGVLAIAGALRHNKGLDDLDLSYTWNGVTWDAVCDSLKTHPTLQVLNLRFTCWMLHRPQQ